MPNSQDPFDRPPPSRRQAGSDPLAGVPIRDPFDAPPNFSNEEIEKKSRSVLENLARGAAFALPSLGTDAIALAGILADSDEIKEYAARLRQENLDALDPQGAAGIAGEILGNLVTLGGVTAGGGRLIARGAARLAPRLAARAGARLATQPAMVRAAARQLPFVPIDAALGAAASPEGERLTGAAEAVGLGLAGGTVLERGAEAIRAGRAARRGRAASIEELEDISPRIEPEQMQTGTFDAPSRPRLTTEEQVVEQRLIDNYPNWENVSPEVREEFVRQLITRQGPGALEARTRFIHERKSIPVADATGRVIDVAEEIVPPVSETLKPIGGAGFEVTGTRPTPIVPPGQERSIWERVHGEGGFALPAAARTLTGAGVGGALGATTSDEPGEALPRALVGAALGASLVNPGAIRSGLQRLIARETRGHIPGGARRVLRTGGLAVPEETWQRLVRRDGGINAHIQSMTNHMRDLMDAVDDVQGIPKIIGRALRPVRDIPPEMTTAINKVLRGKESVSVLPEALRGPVYAIRTHIDQLSQALIDAGAAEGRLALTLTNNKGVYLTRTYKMFEDPSFAKFAENSPEMAETRTKVLALLRSQNPGADEKTIKGLFNMLLAPGDGPMTVLASSPRLAKNLSILQRRSDIPVEIRALWGEVTDPIASYARSIAKMSRLLESHKFLTDFREAGIRGGYLFEDPIMGASAGATHQIAGEGTEVLSPLNGLYTFPELAKSLVGKLSEETRWPIWLMRLTSATKFSKTVLSHVTQIRNVMGNVAIAAANGHINLVGAGLGASAGVIAGDDPLEKIGFGLAGAAAGGVRWPAFARAVRGLNAKYGVGDTPKWRENVLDLQRRGVIGDATRSSELRDVLEETAKHGIEGDFFSSWPVRLGKKFLRGATEAYAIGDDVWKWYGYEIELGRYQRALPDVPIEQVKNQVATIVRNLYPTYSQIPPGIRALRRIPFIGPFVSFPAEMYRTLVNNILTTAKEVGDPRLRNIGLQRLAGLMVTATGGAFALEAFSKHTNGITDEVSEAVRSFMPPWSENSPLLFLNRDEKGKLRVVDLGYTDPYSYMREPLKAFARGENWHDAAVDALWQALKPFASPEILFDKVLEAKEVWNANPHLTDEERIGKVMNKVYEAFEPGTLTSLKRLQEARRGSGTTPSGAPLESRYDERIEWASNVLGMRAMEVDPLRSLGFKARDFAKSLNAAQADLARVARDRTKPLSDETLAQLTQKNREQQLRAFAELRRSIDAAMLLGMSRMDIMRALRDNNLSMNDIKRLLLDRFEAKAPGLQVAPGDPFGREIMRRRREIMLEQRRLRTP